MVRDTDSVGHQQFGYQINQPEQICAPRFLRSESSHRVPAERRFARVVSDLCAPLFTPTLAPPIWIFSPGRAGGDCGRSDRRGCIVFFPAIPIVRSSAEVSACYLFKSAAIAANNCVYPHLS